MTNEIQDQQLAIIDSPLEYPINLLDFQKMFPEEIACLRYLERMRWPNGFVGTVNLINFSRIQGNLMPVKQFIMIFYPTHYTFLILYLPKIQ